MLSQYSPANNFCAPLLPRRGEEPLTSDVRTIYLLCLNITSVWLSQCTAQQSSWKRCILCYVLSQFHSSWQYVWKDMGIYIFLYDRKVCYYFHWNTKSHFNWCHFKDHTYHKNIYFCSRNYRTCSNKCKPFFSRSLNSAILKFICAFDTCECVIITKIIKTMYITFVCKTEVITVKNECATRCQTFPVNYIWKLRHTIISRICKMIPLLQCALFI